VPYFFWRSLKLIPLIFNDNRFKNIYGTILYSPVKEVIFALWSYMTLFAGLWGMLEKSEDDRQIIKKYPAEFPPRGIF
jgi:hypothetical protein